jgi:hypothetical protein
MAVDVYASLKELIEKILGDRDAAMQFASDPTGTLAAQGITDGDLSQVDIRQLVSECASEADLPEGARQALQSYSSGAPAPSHYQLAAPPPAAAHQGTQEVVQHLNYVTYATYEGDEQITQQLINQENYDYSTNIDNSVEVEVDGDVHGDFEVETTNVNATGDGAVAAGDDVENAATGDGAQIIDGDNYGQANTGDGAVQAGGNINAPVNTGEFTGVQTTGPVENTVVGDHNQAAQVSGNADNSTFNFGDGDVTNIGQSTVQDTALATGGGDANNVSNNTLYEGAAAAAGGDATGNFEENYEETHVEAYDSNVATEQGYGNLDQHADLDQSEQEQEAPAA